MKLSLPIIASVFALAATGAQADEISEPPSNTSAQPATLLSGDQLDQLLAPIALYPDALMAVILPAATDLTDLQLAARMLRMESNGAQQIDGQSWDDSVKALAHYPDVLKWMDDNIDWTTQLGAAFAAQPTDVMNAVQRLRERARSAGSLVDSQEQRIVDDNGAIQIEPVQPNVIYVPQYDPELVYSTRGYDYDGPLITFGLGFAAGSWLDYDCDWGARAVWVGRYQQYRYWHPSYLNVRSRAVAARVWHPSARYYNSVTANHWVARRDIVHPHPINAAAGAQPAHLFHPTRPDNVNNAWSRDHREGYIRTNDGREYHYPRSNSTVTGSSSPASASVPSAGALPATRTGPVHVEGFHNEHRRENRVETPNSNAPATSGRFIQGAQPGSVPNASAAPRTEQHYRQPAGSYAQPTRPAAAPSAPRPQPSQSVQRVAPPAPVHTDSAPRGGGGGGGDNGQRHR